MNSQQKARKAMAQSRQHEEHSEKNILFRVEEKIDQSPCQEIEAEARELMIEKRQHEKHTQDTMLSRSESEIGHTTP